MKGILAIGLAFLAGVALVVGIAVWGPLFDGGDSDPVIAMAGGQEGLGLRGMVEYTVLDHDGNVKDYGVYHNTIIDDGFNAFRDRLFSSSTTVSTGAGSKFTAIRLGSTTTTQTQIEAGTYGTKVTTAGTNPANDPAENTSTGTDGQAIIDVTFTATGAATIQQILLVKETDGGTIADGDVFAFQDVNITLANSDTVTFTWTITAS